MNLKLSLFLLFLPLFCLSQVNYTANDQITPYDGHYRAGVNPGYHGSNWSSQTLADIAAGNPAADTKGVGVTAIRGSLPEGLAEQYGYFIWTPIYDYYASIGMKDNTVFVGFASDEHKDPVEYCPGIETDMFANLYEPIWDNGENGTPINDNNYYAAYLYKVINAIGHEVRFWEIWNEPGFDFSGARGWLQPGQPGNWWENNPDPCDYKLRAPVFHFIRTMRISYEIIKTISPEDYVVFSGVGYDSFLDVVLRNTDNPIDGSATSEYPLGGGAYFDVLGFHGYPHFDGSIRYWSNDLGDFVYTRHSDAAIDGMLEKQANRQTILDAYGYDGVTFPEKMWTVTEVNVPRQGFNGQTFGSSTVQVNYITKLVVESIKNNIVQTHVWDLGEAEYEADAINEFDLMGLYEKLDDEEPFTQKITDEGIAYKTASDFLFGCTYDVNKTASMNLPQNIRGGAFQKENGDYVYVLWAITQTDLSENANATFAFPSSFGISNLKKQNWDYSQSNNESTINAQNVVLTGTPIFLSPNINNTLGKLTLTCPDYEFEVGGTQQEGGAYVTWEEPSANTTCPSGGATVTLISDIPNGGFFPFGMTVVHYEATDACGNKTQCAMAIKVASTGGGLGDCHLYRFGFNYRGQFRGNKYLVSLIDTTWAAAKEICESHGGHLATISDFEENEFIKNAISDVAYIGLTDYETEGQLRWEDGSSVSFTSFDNCSWCQDNSSSLDYVEFHPWNGEWSFNDGQAEMFFVMELPCSEQNGCTDNDNDGLCAAEDCNDNNPNLPTSPGTSCNDGNANTDNDVIQSDGCTCEGEETNSPCSITYTINGNAITVNGANAAHVKIRVFTDTWQPVFECFDDCNNPQIINGLAEGGYKLDVLLMNSSWQSICQFNEDFSISGGGGCPDNDNDGTCAVDDCDDNNSAIPTTPGSSCNDNNANTSNDIILSDGCTCQGEVLGGSDCDAVQILSSSGSINISGVNSPIAIIQVFNPNWSIAFSCSNNCDPTSIVNNLAAGTYYVKVKLFNANWQSICDVNEYIAVSNSPCTDADNDGVCANVDCNDANPNLPTTVGSPCNDNNNNTTNDVIQSDGCTCAGETQNAGPCGLAYTVSGNSISFTFDSSPHYKVRVFDPSWQVVFSCLDDCDSPQTINNLAPGTYRFDVLLFDSNWSTDCNTQETFVIESNAGINQSVQFEDQGGTVQLYPNPSEGIIYVLSERGLGQSAVFEVYNAIGIKVKEKFVEELFLNPLKLDVSGNQDGIYTLIIKLEDGRRIARRFILVKD